MIKTWMTNNILLVDVGKIIIIKKEHYSYLFNEQEVNYQYDSHSICKDVP